MSYTPANPLGVLINNEEGEDLCVICQETLNTAPTYMLPECHHKFHTHCIVTWFRAQYCSGDDDTVGGRCPSCGDRGVNSRGRQTRYLGRRWRLSGGDPHYANHLAMMRKESRKEGANSHLVSLVKQEKDSVDKIKETSDAKREYDEYLASNHVDFREARTKRQGLTRAYYAAKRRHRLVQNAIYNFPIVPLIIPTFVDINW